MANISIPSDPRDKMTIQNAAKMISENLTFIEDRKEQIKEIVEDIHEKFEIDKRAIRKMGTLYHKQSFQDEVSAFNEFEHFYESIMNAKNNIDNSTEDD